MSAPRAAAHGLSTQDVESIRGTLAAGRRPKVLFTEAAGQIAGQIGQVVELTDPAAGDDYVVVRFGRDELPFSPTDLAIPPRNPARRAAAKPAPPAPELRLTQPPVPPAREEKKTIMSTPTVDERPATTADGPSTGDGPALGAEAARPTARKAAKQARPKAPAALAVTLTYAEGEWMVAAQQGSKVLAKPYLIKPAEALKMVGLLDVPGVHEAVEQIVSTERAQAQHQAQRLRAELAEVEARLAELGEATARD